MTIATRAELDRVEEAALAGWPEGVDVALGRWNDHLRSLADEEDRDEALRAWGIFMAVHRDDDDDDDE
jgi:hypothetical protein